ncbi:aminoglycoside phosphotransferase family protein [Arthrobacter sp. NEB 688]|uniref:aminoglycoside phosphotransferase family protein n=1 Tax=Arthrobacter sp. NEB 688 TaxID=904039 RepID=UPI001564A840|nr:aminoglycoside phosphotransferase family protein [Arthrobacter sp. NEB 688]QKE84679.1 aminoglycoside phosphotransferase family protein [Arthrobacter sp. NEB 688]
MAPPSADAAAVPTPGLVTRLLREQVPELAGLPVRPSPTSGSSNSVFRLGDDLAVRMPREERYVPDLLTEVRWLPHLAPSLPVPVPQVVAVGRPAAGFERPWSVVTWLPGEVPLGLSADDEHRLARDLGAFVGALHAVPVAGAPVGPEHWGYRSGEPVTDAIDAWADEAADALSGLFDPAAVREAWRRLRDVPPASGPPCWVHTDLSPENVLCGDDGRLTGVVDFGGLGVGDPSVDLLYAWGMFGAPARETFRAAAGADEATWLRARAWSFVGPGVLTLAAYRRSMPARAASLTTMVEAVAAEVAVRLR